MNQNAIIATFESSLSEDLNARQFLDANSAERPFLVVSFIGSTYRLLRQAEHLHAQSPSTELGDCIQELRTFVREKTPQACQLILAAIRSERLNTLTESAADGEEWTTCGEEIQKHNREALNGLRDADSIGERWSVIKEWGKNVREDLGKCVDEAIGRRGRNEP